MQTKDCDVCMGQGVVETLRPGWLGEPVVEAFHVNPCYECNGTGRVDIVCVDCEDPLRDDEVERCAECVKERHLDRVDERHWRAARRWLFAPPLTSLRAVGRRWFFLTGWERAHQKAREG